MENNTYKIPKITISGNFTLLPFEDFIKNKLSDLLDEKIELSLISDSFFPQELLADSYKKASYDDVFAIFINIDFLELDEGSKANTDTFTLIESFCDAYPGNIVILICPTLEKNNIAAIKKEKISSLKLKKNVLIYDPLKVSQYYKCEEIFNSHTASQANLPYTKEYYSILATFLVRVAIATRNPHKVLVVDCDDTLWTGICGEDSLKEISITKSQKALQAFLKQKKIEGFIICLCSNNNSKDVLRVFNEHKDMSLCLEDIAAWRINWDSKYKKLTELANELSLSIDSFIIIDDSMIELMKIKNFFPDITTIFWPKDNQAGTNTLLHLWAADKIKMSTADSLRSDFYKKSPDRKLFQAACQTREEFLKKLNIQFEIAQANDFERLSQLSWRVNQFRFNDLRLTTNQIYDFANLKDHQAYQISVRDCFGDYGIVGFLLFEINAEKLNILELCLSCRALGRDIEVSIIKFIQKAGKSHGCHVIRANLLINENNNPARQFIKKISPIKVLDSKTKLVFSFSVESELNFHSESKGQEEPFFDKVKTLQKKQKLDYQKIIFSLSNFSQKKCNVDNQLPLKKRLLSIWKNTVGRKYDSSNTFISQASSLELVYFAANIYKYLGYSLNLAELFSKENMENLATSLGNEISSSQIHSKAALHQVKYPLTMQQKLICTSMALFGENLYRTTHCWELSGLPSINKLENQLWKIIKAIPELRATIDNSKNVIIHKAQENSKNDFIKVISCETSQINFINKKIMSSTSCVGSFPASKFYILHSGKNKAVVILLINHVFFDQFSIDNFITKNILQINNKKLASIPSLSNYKRIENTLAIHRAHEDMKYFYKSCLNATPFEFPTLKTRRPIYTCKEFILEIDAQIVQQFKATKNKLKISTFDLIFSGLAAAFLHYKDSLDPFVLGTAFTTRDNYTQNTIDLFGPLFNVIPITLKYEMDVLIRDWIYQTSSILKTSEKHKLINTNELMGKLNTKRTEGKHPLFPIIIVWHESGKIDSPKNDIVLENYEFKNATTEFDLVIYVNSTEKNINLKIAYAGELYSLEQIKNLGDIFLSTLKNFHIENFSKKVSQLNLLPPHIATSYHSEQVIYDQDTTIWHLIEIQTKTFPNKTAIKYEEKQLTYSQLSEKVKFYSIFLDHNLKNKQVFALIIDDKLQYTLTMLAALRIGIPFIPLTKELYSYLSTTHGTLSDITIITDMKELSQHCSSNKIHVLPTKLINKKSCESEPPLLEGIAYMIFTSGSTGVPKAVEIKHISIINLILDFKKRLNTDWQTTMLAHTNVTFDIAFLELLLPLISGGCCILVKDSISKDPALLKRIISENSCNLIQATPTTFQILLDANWINLTKATLLVGGEELSTTLAKSLTSISSETWNVYGPTETTIWCMTHKIETYRNIKLGSPISNTFCFIRNSLGLLAAPGSFGELYIGGDCIAQGYWKSLEKTKQYFSKDPVSNKMVYASGDKVWIDPEDATISFVGRKDRQIKLNGRRIELAEVEAALSSLEGIKQSIVLISIEDEKPKLYGFVLSNEKSETVINLRKKALEKLPGYLIPDNLYIIDKIPTNQHEKIDYLALKKLIAVNAPPLSPDPDNYSDLLNWIIDWCESELSHDASICKNSSFFENGGTSLLAIKLAKSLGSLLNKRVIIAEIFKYHTLEQLASGLSKNVPTPSDKLAKVTPPLNNDKIAIIGLAINLPSIDTPDKLWQLLDKRECTIRSYSDNELMKFKLPEEVLSNSNFKPIFSHIDKQYEFDADYFEITPRDAILTDPQHRILMELTVKALEDACVLPDEENNCVGIYASCSSNYYLKDALFKLPDVLSREKLSLEIASNQSFLATKIAYKLNLQGPAISLGTTCSSGLTCVSSACQVLLAGKAHVMVAAAASISLDHQLGYIYEQGHIFSKSGKCNPFTEAADGVVPGSGAAALVLKPLDKALADGNPIYAVIEGFATNNDGKRKASYTMPSLDAHVDCIHAALNNNQLKHDHVAYIEAHGTGTYVGDPIEVEALKQGYNAMTSHCWLGSLKANIGHTNIAAGLIGLAKLCLAREKNLIPGTPSSSDSIAALSSGNAQFKLLTKTIVWPKDKPLASISSLGIGGTNNHIVVGPAPNINQKEHNEANYVFCLTAKNVYSLELLKKEIYNYIIREGILENSPKLASLCYTFFFKRKHHAERFICIFEKVSFLLTALASKETLSIEEGQNLKQHQELAVRWSNHESINGELTNSTDMSYIHAPTYCFDHRGSYDIKLEKGNSSKNLNMEPLDLPSTFKILKDIFEEVLGYCDVPVDKDFFKLGGDSLTSLDLIAHIEKKFAISLAMDDIHLACSIEKLSDLIQKKTAEKPSIELISLNNNPGKPTLILIHPGNGNVYHYRPLADLLSRVFQIYAISYPVGREEFASIPDMALNYIELIENKIRSPEKYFLGGWSYGATVAQEMNVHLEQLKIHLPQKLILIDGWAQYNRSLLEKKHFFEAFFESSDLQSNTPENNMWLDLFWDKISNRMRMLIDHVPNITYNNTLLIKAKTYPRHYVAKNLKKNGWEKYIKGKLELHIVQGDHNKMMEHPYLDNIAETLINLVATVHC